MKNFFKNDITRNIETVIKADDRDHISDEVVEYVITREVANKIQFLFREYNDYQGANGAWISGFFGSGKSHLLKILSYVLENKENDGYRCGELFAEKIEDDQMLKADVLAATRIPSESILFNIDQQAQITSKSDANAVLAVFYKVFFDHLGYYGFQPHVAEFEMWLDKQGKYPAFKEEFQAMHGKPWEEARLDYFDPAVTDDVASSLGKVFQQEPSKYENILDEIEDRHKHSIEDFCNRVFDYVKSKNNHFRLNFFVDELGQYISGDNRLMLNIQTLAETLATRTRGQSWIFVTSQEDMEKVVGDMTKSQQNDFSKIQARFKFKIPLTSANVDEVIEKRLLQKNEAAQVVLEERWTAENANLDTLLSFSAEGVQFRKYRDKDDFVRKFPFVAYQFSLFQECRRALSTHNAFQGKHQSVGERSMLGVFQQVVKGLDHGDDTTLVSFDKMYEGIRNELRGEIQRSIILAENNLENPFAIRVIKTLFMVKYFSNFKTTRRNISVLLIDSMHINLKEHEANINEALNILENQSYVQRNGEVYEFLTDDEKDIEERIKATDIDDQAITTLMKEIFFDEIIRDSRIRYAGNKQDYDFAARIDGVMLGREKELQIEIITPNYRGYDDITALQAQTMGTSCMRLILPQDNLFVRDLRLYLRTLKYVRINQSTALRPEVKRILQDKAQLNIERRRLLIEQGKRLLAQSTIFMSGSKRENGQTQDGRTKVTTAFQDLIQIVYSNLHMIGSTLLTEDTLRQIVRSRHNELLETETSTMSEAESDVLTLLRNRKKASERTTLSDVRDHFESRPFGWYPNAIWVQVARLYKRNQIDLRKDVELLDDEGVLEVLLNTRTHSSVLLEPKTRENPEDVRALKDFYIALFDETPPGNNGKETGNAFKAKLREWSGSLEQFLRNQRNYPFLACLDPAAALVEKLSQKEYVYYLNHLSKFKEELLQAKHEQYDPIMRFWNSEQRNIFEEIQQFLHRETSNLEYINGPELAILREVLTNPAPYQGSVMRDAKSAMDIVRQGLHIELSKEKAEASAALLKAQEELKHLEEFGRLRPEEQESLLEPFMKEEELLKTQAYIANVRDTLNRVTNHLLPAQLNKCLILVNPLTEESARGGVKENTVKYIPLSAVKIPFARRELKNQTDIEQYLKAMREALLACIDQNKRIKL